LEEAGVVVSLRLLFTSGGGEDDIEIGAVRVPMLYLFSQGSSVKGVMSRITSPGWNSVVAITELPRTRRSSWVAKSRFNSSMEFRMDTNCCFTVLRR
jgi:hypothetical protein